MNRSRKQPRYVSRVVAQISSIIGAIEMMRYDSCHPECEVDSGKLESMTHAKSGTAADHLVCFIRVARDPGPPTYDRWRSFNCTVLDVQDPDSPRPTDDEMLAMLKKNRPKEAR